MLEVRNFCLRHSAHAGIASITPNLRAYRYGTGKCYYILCLMANRVQDVVAGCFRAGF